LKFSGRQSGALRRRQPRWCYCCGSPKTSPHRPAFHLKPVGLPSNWTWVT